jgi:hypothetical protein
LPGRGCTTACRWCRWSMLRWTTARSAPCGTMPSGTSCWGAPQSTCPVYFVSLSLCLSLSIFLVGRGFHVPAARAVGPFILRPAAVLRRGRSFPLSLFLFGSAGGLVCWRWGWETRAFQEQLLGCAAALLLSFSPFSFSPFSSSPPLFLSVFLSLSLKSGLVAAFMCLWQWLEGHAFRG